MSVFVSSALIGSIKGGKMTLWSNRMMYPLKLIISVFCILITLVGSALAQSRLELNTILMESTFKIQGDGSLGTGFIIGRQSKKDPKKAYYVLVTAAHVLNEMKGDKAQILLRKKKEDGSYEKLPFPMDIRKNNNPLWVCHEEADVAAMYIGLPDVIGVPLLTTDFLADDLTFDEYEIHPGDKLMCLGYPLGAEANKMGFPILRSGEIASYPLTPIKVIKSFLYDVEIFKGNSGGPVYFVESSRAYKGAIHVSTIQFIAGIVTKERVQIKAIQEPYKTTIEGQRLSLAEVVHAIFIKETIEKLQELE